MTQRSFIGEVFAELDSVEFSAISDYVKHQVIRDLVERNKQLEEKLAQDSQKGGESPDDTPLTTT